MMKPLSRRVRLLLPFVWRDIREQYAGSWGGVIWSVFQPLFLILLYWWVFSQIFRVRVPIEESSASPPFMVFLLSALLPWFAFQDGIVRGSGAIITRRDVVKKVNFPVIVFPLAAVTAASISHGIGFAIFLLGFFVWQGQVAIGQLIIIAGLLILQLIVTGGLALLLAAITVYLRDVSQMLGLIMPAFFYTAPILYPLSLVPEKFHLLVYLNPFTAFAESYHAVILENSLPSLIPLGFMVLLMVGATTAGVYVFKRLQPGFADVL